MSFKADYLFSSQFCKLKVMYTFQNAKVEVKNIFLNGQFNKFDQIDRHIGPVPTCMTTQLIVSDNNVDLI